jgi:iron complex outermembrane receptor protein
MRSLISILLVSSALTSAAMAQNAVSPDAEAEADTIVVTGRGQSRQVQELTTASLEVLAPGTSALKAIEKLPSVNFQSADPFGNYEWAQRVSIRSFNQNQIGFTLDGIPLGDASYGNVNGMHVSRAISPENIGITRVSQGAGGISTQATNNLGGTIEFLSADPLGETAIDVSGSYGSNNMYRGFIRANLGTKSGARGYVSYSYYSTDKWKGVGEQRQHLINAKVIVPVGNVDFDAYGSYSDRRENDYQDLSLSLIRNRGYALDNISGDYALALRIADVAANRGDSGAPALNPAAGTTYPSGIQGPDDVYFNAGGLRQDALIALGMTAPINDKITAKLKGYYHHNKGAGLWYTPYLPSPSGVPISVRTTEYGIDRAGLFGSVDADLGINKLTVGAWFENNDFDQARRFYGLTSRTVPGVDSLTFPSNPFATQWDFSFNTKTYQYFVEDKIELGDLTINAGWKGFQVDIEADPRIAGGLASGKIRSRDWFQPHAGAVYKVSGSTEVFAGFTQVMRAFTGAATGGPFSTTQVGFNAIRNTLKPEKSDTYELGLRYNEGPLNAVLGAYYVNFSNRLLAITTGSGIQGNPSVLQNVGGVRAVGLEALANLKLGHGLSLFGSYAYNDSTYQDNVVNSAGTVIAQTDGKTTVDSPKHIARGEINYDDGAFFGRVGINYMSKRYYTYENIGVVPHQTLVDASIGYRLPVGLRKPVEIQLNAVNLFDSQYISTIGTAGFVNRDPNGAFQTLMVGAPQTFFVTLKAGL